MRKTLVAFGAIFLSTVAIARFHGALADWIAPAHTIAPVAQVSNQPPAAALGEAKADWSALFNR
jgi:hypothetical protein